MAILSPGDLFRDTILVDVGEDKIELHNPTVEEVADIRAGFVAVIQEACEYPYDDALEFVDVDKTDEELAIDLDAAGEGVHVPTKKKEPKYRAVWDYMNNEVTPAMRALLWKNCGMPDDDRIYRGVLSRMTVAQQGRLLNVYIESVGMDAVFDAARRSGDGVGNR